MKKIVTAIGDEKIHNRLKEDHEYEVLGKDIQYQEGIFELLDQDIEIEYLMISDFLQGNFPIEELIEKIKKRRKNLKIILVYSNEDGKKDELLRSKKIEEAINYRKITYQDLITESIRGEVEKDSLIKEIENLKKEIKQIKKEKKRYAIVIVMLGDRNVGKTSVCLMMSHMLTFQKVLIIDFDYERGSLLRITRKEQNQEIEKRINNRINICNGKEIFQNFEAKIEKFKQKYDVILIDTNTEDPLHVNNILSRISDLNIFIIESSYLGNIKGMEFFVKNERSINWKKTKVLFNRFSKHSLTRTTLIKNFREFSILGIIRETGNYAKNMNLRYREHYGGIREWKEYQKIIKRIKYPDKVSERVWIAKLKYK